MQQASVLAQQLAQVLLNNKCSLVTAESCTGGMVATALTDIAGCSAWLERGFVSYSNLAKQQMLGVDAKLIEDHGAVSEQVAKAMAAGALTHSAANVSLAITGIAGPSGGTKDKPVGTVWFAWQLRGQQPQASRQLFAGSRCEIRQQAVNYSLTKLIDYLGKFAR